MLEYGAEDTKVIHEFLLRVYECMTCGVTLHVYIVGDDGVSTPVHSFKQLRDILL